jgi:hypothetical protein
METRDDAQAELSELPYYSVIIESWSKMEGGEQAITQSFGVRVNSDLDLLRYGVFHINSSQF